MAESASARSRSTWRGQALPARVASGTILGVLALGGTWIGGVLFQAILALVLAVALVEFLRMARAGGHPVYFGPGLILGAAVLAYRLVPGLPGRSAVLVAVALLFLVASLRPPLAGRAAGLALTLLGSIYVLGLGLELHDLRARPDGAALVLAVLLGTWAADTAAFFVGLRWGRRRLAPAVSPAKSVEGLVGGMAISLAVTAAVVALLAPHRGWPQGLLLGGVVMVAAPLGDLFESFLKRSFEVKDASRLIPGHGGVLDRVDSLLMAGAGASIALEILKW